MSIKIVGIIGSGLMGTGIAQACATAGLDVIVRDIDPAALKRCVAQVSSSLTRLVDKQKLTESAKAAALAAIRTTADIKDLSGADFIIEAATENLALKQKILQEVEAIATPSCIIATNTSSVSITKLAAACGCEPASPPVFLALSNFSRGSYGI